MSPLFSLCLGSAAFVILLIAGICVWGGPFIAGVGLTAAALVGAVILLIQEGTRPW